LLYGFVAFFISFTEKKRSKESRPDDLLNPACASAKGRVLLRFILLLVYISAQLEQGKVAAYICIPLWYSTVSLQ